MASLVPYSACGIALKIDGTDCIGASRTIINDNFAALEGAVCTLSTIPMQVVDSNSVNLTYNTVTRTLTADVIPGVIHTQSSVTNLSADDEFVLWRDNSTVDGTLRKVTFTNLKANILPAPTVTYITSATDINVYIDNSGSMASTKPYIQEMITYYLSAAVLPFYNNNTTVLNQRLKVFATDTSERCFNWISTIPSSGATNVVNIAVINEAESGYYTNSFTPKAARLAGYNTDIATLRGNLATYSTNMKGVIIQVQYKNYTDAAGRAFRNFLYSIQKGIDNYSGSNGLSDKSSQISFVYDALEAVAASYYADLLNKALLSLN